MAKLAPLEPVATESPLVPMMLDVACTLPSALRAWCGAGAVPVNQNRGVL